MNKLRQEHNGYFIDGRKIFQSGDMKDFQQLVISL